MNSAQQFQEEAVIDIFKHILIRKHIFFPPQRVVQLLHDKYVKQAYDQFCKQNKFDFGQSKICQSSHSIISIIDLSDEIHEESHAQSQKNTYQRIQQNEIIIIGQNRTENQDEISKKSIGFPKKLIQKHTERAFYLLEDPFTPKNYQESLVQNYIDFRNIKFSDAMPVSRAQQRKSQNQKRVLKQKFTHSQDSPSDQNFKYKKQIGFSLQSQPLWKNRIKLDKSYMSSLAEVWTLQENCMTRKKQLIKSFHEQRQVAKLLIKFGYGIKNIRHKLEIFNDKKNYHKTAYAVVKQAFRCIESDLIEKEKETIKQLTLKDFRKVMCFLAHYHDSFKEDEEKKHNFSQYIKIAYLIKIESPKIQQSFSLYNFILKGVLSQADKIRNIIHLD